MSAAAALARLGTFLFWLAVAVFVGTVVELLAARHWQDPIQFLPFALCAAGLAALVAARTRPGPRTSGAARAVMAVLAAASLLGVYEHLQGNLGFMQETHPNASGWPLVLAVLTGRAPLGASGVLVVAALLALASLEATRAARPEPAAVPEAQYGVAGRSAQVS